MVYIDLNMVRAGVVSHPSEYKFSSYNEIQNPPERYGIINRKKLLDYFSMRDEKSFRKEHGNWIIIALKNNGLPRNPAWSEAIAVGDKPFLKNIQEKLAGRAQGRSIVKSNGSAVLQEPEILYSTVFGTQKDVLSPENTYFWR